jgi:hypothetical protein
MIISAHLNFFSIDECGLYRHGDSQPKGVDAAETFELIHSWVRGKPLEDTIPWDPSESRAGVPKCYCHDAYKCESTGEYLFVLWKSDTDSAGTLLGAQATATTGSGDVVEYTNNYKGKRVIWGRPCYYWVIPKLKTIVSVKLEHSVCDSQMLQDWVTKCINNRVAHPNKVRHLTETGLIRLAFNDSTDTTGAKYAYRFDVKLRSLETASAELQDLSARVTHIVRRETIRLQVGQDDRADWIKMFDKIPYLSPKPKAKSRQIEVRAEAKPTAAEIKRIVESFAKEERKPSDWNNVGFETDSGTVWADRYRLRATINLNQDSESVFAAATMHERLSKNRHSLLAPVERDEGIATTRRTALR